MKQETKSLILKILLGALAVVFLAAVGWFVYHLMQFKTYHDNQFKFSIKYPSSWLMKEGHLGTAVTFVRPKQSGLDVFEPNANITVQEVPDEIATLSSFSATITKQMTAVFKTNIKIVEDKSYTFGNRQGHVLIIDAPNPQNLRAVFVWTIKGSMGYILTFISRLDQYPSLSPTLKEMIQSFEFK